MMSRRSTASTSSNLTDQSPPWEDLSRLGEYLIAQLGDPYHQDLLAHWMAHQLAEFIQTERDAASESERLAARSAASDLIPRLWEARRHWPSGWPPPEASKLRQLLEQLEPNSLRGSRPDVEGEPWWDALSEIQELHREEMRIYLHGAIAELEITAIAAALAAAHDIDATTEEDLEFMRTAVELRGSTDEWFVEHAQHGEKPTRRSHRAQIIEREIANIDERRHHLLGRAVAYAGSYRRKRSKTGRRAGPKTGIQDV
jgi:hypothetical protein